MTATDNAATRRLVIDRQTWRRGGGLYNEKDGPTHLLNDRGKMCCLGFAAIQLCGWTPKVIFERGDPQDAALGEFCQDPTGLFLDGTDLTDLSIVLVRINDADLDPADRERYIADALAAHGVAVEFVN